MKIITNGKQQVEVEIDVIDCLDKMFKNLGFNEDYFVKDNALYETVDIGHHCYDGIDRFRSSDKEEIEAFNAIQFLKIYFKSK